MGTNYYWHEKPPCPCCGATDEPIHIGKSSWGWCFSLHVDRRFGINTLEDWIERFNREGSYIRDEYEGTVEVEEMVRVITQRGKPAPTDWERIAQVGLYKSEEDFHRRNHSERGPNNLLRHQIGDFCAGHGEGTWDYIEWEFS